MICINFEMYQKKKTGRIVEKSRFFEIQLIWNISEKNRFSTL